MNTNPWTGEAIEPVDGFLSDLPTAREVRFPARYSRGEPDYENIMADREWARGL